MKCAICGIVLIVLLVVSLFLFALISGTGRVAKGGLNEKEILALQAMAVRSMESTTFEIFGLRAFGDNVERYVGHLVSMPLKCDVSPGTLMEYKGEEITFRPPQFEFHEISIHIPDTLAVPKAKYGHLVQVSFICTEGSLRRGNEAFEIGALRSWNLPVAFGCDFGKPK